MKKLLRYYWNQTPAEIWDAISYPLRKYAARAKWDNILCAMGFCGAMALVMRYRDSLGHNEAIAATVAPVSPRRAEPIRSNFQYWRHRFPDGETRYFRNRRPGPVD